MLTRMNPRNIKNREGGFTLIELLIVVAIIGILAALAIPSYINYLKKTRTNECVTALGNIRDTQKAYWADEYMGNGSYAPDLATINWEMKGGGTDGKYYTYSTDDAMATCTAKEEYTDKVSHPVVNLIYATGDDATDRLEFKTGGDGE